jgi:signal transduction histidine kinase
VPELADWCAVDVVDEGGRIRRLAVEHVDPSRIEQARRFDERFPPGPDAARGVHQVIRTGQPWMLSGITDDLVVASARSPEHLAAIRELGIASLMMVPLIARGRILGALTFASTDPKRQYGPADLQFIQDVASRAALAMDNALAYDEANRANRAKDQFVATMSHELRTPLNAILGWAQMLLRPDLPADQRQRAAEVIVRSAQAQNQLLSDIFDMAAIVQGKLRLSPQPVDMRPILESVRDAAAPAASTKRISVALALPADCVMVHGDTGRLQQVFSNLVLNAVKFTPEQGRVEIRLEVRDRHADVSIADTGIGISPDVLPYVFDRFRQAHAATAPELRGLGLGLAIVKQLVDGHGGTVTASSPGDGQGSTFVVRLPLAQP